MTHFQIFKMPQTYDIDEVALDKTFKQLQMLLHPDRFALKSETERKISAIQSSLVTQAYQVLKNPKLRAEYLLALQGHKVDVTDVDQEFLMEMMELMEVLNENDELTQEQLKELMQMNERERSEVGRLFSQSFDARDWSKAKQYAAKLNYLVRVRDTIYERLDVGNHTMSEHDDNNGKGSTVLCEEHELPDCGTCVHQDECAQALVDKQKQ